MTSVASRMLWIPATAVGFAGSYAATRPENGEKGVSPAWSFAGGSLGLAVAAGEGLDAATSGNRAGLFRGAVMGGLGAGAILGSISAMAFNPDGHGDIAQGLLGGALAGTAIAGGYAIRTARL